MLVAVRGTQAVLVVVINFEACRLLLVGENEAELVCARNNEACWVLFKKIMSRVGPRCGFVNIEDACYE